MYLASNMISQRFEFNKLYEIKVDELDAEQVLWMLDNVAAMLGLLYISRFDEFLEYSNEVKVDADAQDDEADFVELAIVRGLYLSKIYGALNENNENVILKVLCEAEHV